MKLRQQLSAFCSAAALLAAVPVFSQDVYPNRPITVVVTFAAGSGSDVMARIYVKALGDVLNATAIVENRPGANGMIGAQLVAKAKPDGYTVLAGSGTVNAANYALFANRITYGPKSFDAVALLTAQPVVLFAPKSLPGNTVDAVLEAAKRNPNGISCGSGNAVTQVACEALKIRAGVDLTTVPYKGNSQSLTDLAGEQLSIAFSDLSAAAPYLGSGRLKAIAVASKERLGSLSEVGTFEEQRISDFEFMSWGALFVPARTPKPVIEKLNAVARQMLKSAEWQKQMQSTGGQGLRVTGELREVQEFVAAEVTRWAKYIRETGVKLD